MRYGTLPVSYGSQRFQKSSKTTQAIAIALCYTPWLYCKTPVLKISHSLAAGCRKTNLRTGRNLPLLAKFYSTRECYAERQGRKDIYGLTQCGALHAAMLTFQAYCASGKIKAIFDRWCHLITVFVYFVGMSHGTLVNLSSRESRVMKSQTISVLALICVFISW